MFLILNFMVKNMLYSIKLEIWHYICSGKRENKFVGLTRSPSTREHKINEDNMEKANNTIEMLQYQLKRYKAMKKGATCQSLQAKLQKLMNQAQD